jgi:hypothetical protein
MRQAFLRNSSLFLSLTLLACATESAQVGAARPYAVRAVELSLYQREVRSRPGPQAPEAKGSWLSLWVDPPSGLRNAADYPNLLARVAADDREWAERIGADAPALVGDDQRVLLTPERKAAAQDLVQSCPDEDPDHASQAVASPEGRANYERGYAQFMAKLQQAGHDPALIHSVDADGDTLTHLLDCEWTHTLVLGATSPTPVAASTSAPTPSTPSAAATPLPSEAQAAARPAVSAPSSTPAASQPTATQALGSAESPEELRRAFLAQPHYAQAAEATPVPVEGCSEQHLWVVQRAKAGKFTATRKGSLVDDLGPHPVPCAKFPHPGKAFAKELAEARASWKPALGQDDVLSVAPDARWEVHKNAKGQPVDRTLLVTLWRHHGQLKALCGTKSALDTCEQGGDPVVLLFNAAVKSAEAMGTGDAHLCRVSSYAAFHQADALRAYRARAMKAGTWSADRRYLPAVGTPLAEVQLVVATDQLAKAAQQRFAACHGQSLGDTDLSFWMPEPPAETWFKRASRPSAPSARSGLSARPARHG